MNNKRRQNLFGQEFEQKKKHTNFFFGFFQPSWVNTLGNQDPENVQNVVAGDGSATWQLQPAMWQ